MLARAAGVPPEFLHAAAQSTTVLALIMVLSNVGAVYEAIVMGGHRIDLARNFATFFTVAEAVALVILLHFGFGLFAMASVMAASEVGFVLCCYASSKKILPPVVVSRKFVTRKVLPELFRFAGSYQLVNVLEAVSYTHLLKSTGSWARAPVRMPWLPFSIIDKASKLRRIDANITDIQVW